MAAEFVQEYLDICRERCVESHDGLLKCLKRPCASPGLNGKACLNLRTTNLDEQTCAILGKMLSTDRLFELVDLADCSLSDAAVSNVICGLNTNSACHTLNLKGNNIRGKSVECLGRMLRQNTNLKSLILEWNNAGMLDDSFMVFCEGVGGSCSLVDLDLRSNQISHKGAEELATALKRNSTLQRLDLRWNNIGIVGAKYLLDAFQFNRTLGKIDLNGNDIPEETRKAIAKCARSNAELLELTGEYQSRTHKLTNELAQTKHQSAVQYDSLMGKIEDKEEILRKTNRHCSKKVEHFKELLDERKSAFNSLTSRLSRLESEKLLADQRVKDLEVLLSKEKDDKESLTSSYRNELRSSQEQHNVLQSRLNTQVSNVTKQNESLASELKEVKGRSDSQLKQIHDLKELVANLQAEARLSAANHNEMIKKEQLKQSQIMREMTQQKDKEIEQVRADQSVIEKTLREHNSRVERQKRDCEEEMSTLKAQLISERMKAEEELAQMRQKMKADQEFHIHHMEEKLKIVHMAKDEAHQMNSQQGSVISDLQTKNNSLSMSVENLKHQIDTLQQGLASKNQDIELAKQTVQNQMRDKLSELEKEVDRLNAVCEKRSKNERRLEEKISRLEESVEKRGEELRHAKEKLAMRESEITWMREENAQRAHALQAAVRNYTQPLSASP